MGTLGEADHPPVEDAPQEAQMTHLSPRPWGGIALPRCSVVAQQAEADHRKGGPRAELMDIRG